MWVVPKVTVCMLLVGREIGHLIGGRTRVLPRGGSRVAFLNANRRKQSSARDKKPPS
jgi:hypothetical protein